MTFENLFQIAEKAFYKEPPLDNPLFPNSVYYRFFRLVAAEFKPKLAVVLGVCGGGDSYHLCLGNPEAQVVGVDIAYDHPEQMAYIKENCSGFRFWEGDSVESARPIHQAFGLVDFLFVDTVHEEGATIAEFEAWKPYLAPGALVCFDDLFRPGMEEAWERLPEPKMRMDFLHDGTYPDGGGFGILLMP